MLRTLAGIALLGCSSSTSNPGGSPGDGGADTGADAACATVGALCSQDPSGCCQCGSSSCEQQTTACLCDPDCADALLCGFKCAAEAGTCVDDCGKGNPSFAALRACAKSKCQTQCQ